MLNGLIGEADSLLKATLQIMDDEFTRKANRITSVGKKVEIEYAQEMEKMGEMLRSILGLLVIVPSNPGQAYFNIMEGILNFTKKEEWGESELSFRIQISVLDSCIRYLASQT